MRELHPWELIAVGFGLVFFGCSVPFLMVMSLLEPSFFLSFLSYAASLAGVLLGLVGAANYVRRNRG